MNSTAAIDTASDPLAFVESAGQAALDAADAEASIRVLAQACLDQLGDREAHLRPGCLRAGERHYSIAGAFMVTPDRQHHMLVGSIGFPPEQERLMVPIDGGHPGHVHATRTKLILKNTDDHGAFRQYLKSSRMGSALFAPMIWQGRFHGQLIMAAQARNTMRDEDLAGIVALSKVATACWIAHGGPAWLDRVFPPANAFYVGREGLDGPG